MHAYTPGSTVCGLWTAKFKKTKNEKKKKNHENLNKHDDTRKKLLYTRP